MRGSRTKNYRVDFVCIKKTGSSPVFFICNIDDSFLSSVRFFNKFICTAISFGYVANNDISRLKHILIAPIDAKARRTIFDSICKNGIFNLLLSLLWQSF